MKNIVFLMLIVFVLSACDTTKITATGDRTYYIGPDSGLPGNCEFFVMPETNHGPSLLAINGPAAPVGFQIRNGATKYFQDQYIGPNAESFQSGSSLPLNQWLQFNFVIYKSSFTGWLWPLVDFWTDLGPAIIESSYEWQVKFVDDGSGNLSVELLEDK